MKVRVIVLFVFVLATILANGQIRENIRTGRPGYSIGAGVVGSGFIQHQMGLNHASVLGDAILNSTNHVVRYGINEHFEVGLNCTVLNYRLNGSSDWSTDRLGVAVRTAITQEKKVLPTIALQIGSKLPETGRSFLPRAILTMSKRLTPSLVIGSNLIYNWIEQDAGLTQLTLHSNFALNKKWGCFGEIYFQDFSQMNRTIFATGISYLMNPNFQWDLYSGYELNNNNMYLISFGISWRIQTEKTN